MDGTSRSRGWDKEIPHGVLPTEQLVLSAKWARNCNHLHLIRMTNIKAWMSLNFVKIPSPIMELAPLEHLKN